jgi:PHD/YefM family antitoxin component YafN of YafNO toxin-antitoxin module
LRPDPTLKGLVAQIGTLPVFPNSCFYSVFCGTFKGALKTQHPETTFDITKDIQSMTAFRRNPVSFMKRLKKSRQPIILTVNGKAEAVVQDAEAYQRLLDIAAQADALEGIRQGLEDNRKGHTREAREVFDEIRAEHDIPR